MSATNKNQSEILVSVIVCTYNQENSIRQTLDCILTQKTEYNFEIIIGEDYGTDGTRKICEEYSKRHENIFLVPQDENYGITKNFFNCLSYTKGKYIMVCAGDDYWHNPQKIQLQTDYMETHPNCVICHTDYDVLYFENKKIEHNCNKTRNRIPPEGNIHSNIMNGESPIQTVTYCIRKDVLIDKVPYKKFIEKKFPYEDLPIQLVLSTCGDINYIPVSTATYRVGQESITNMFDYEKIQNKYINLKKMMKSLFDMFPEWGEFTDDKYYDEFVFHSLLIAAYHNDDYLSAKEFAKSDPTNNMSKRMANNRLTFEFYRLYKKIKSH